MATQHSRSAARLMMAPAVVMLLGWMLVPLAMTLYFSFKRYLPLRGDSLGDGLDWVGFENYVRFVSASSFWPSVLTTLVIVGGVLIITVVLTFGYHIICRENAIWRSGFPGQKRAAAATALDMILTVPRNYSNTLEPSWCTHHPDEHSSQLTESRLPTQQTFPPNKAPLLATSRLLVYAGQRPAVLRCAGRMVLTTSHLRWLQSWWRLKTVHAHCQREVVSPWATTCRFFDAFVRPSLLPRPKGEAEVLEGNDTFRGLYCLGGWRGF